MPLPAYPYDTPGGTTSYTPSAINTRTVPMQLMSFGGGVPNVGNQLAALIQAMAAARRPQQEQQSVLGPRPAPVAPPTTMQQRGERGDPMAEMLARKQMLQQYRGIPIYTKDYNQGIVSRPGFAYGLGHAGDVESAFGGYMDPRALAAGFGPEVFQSPEIAFAESAKFSPSNRPDYEGNAAAQLAAIAAGREDYESRFRSQFGRRPSQEK